jgi:energy-coupling factor transporter transmembrane protein EcfT
MTSGTPTGLPQTLAFIATIFVILSCGIFATVLANREGKLRARQIWKILGIFCFLLFLIWATAGYLNGDAFVESGLRPFGLVLQTLPYLLKAL